MSQRGLPIGVSAVIVSCLLVALGWGAEDSTNIPAQVGQDVQALGGASPAAREGAAVRLYSRGPEYFPAIEAASRRKDLKPDVSAKFKEIVEHIRPWNGARNRAARISEGESQWNQSSALVAYDAVGKKNPKWDAMAKEGIKLYLTPGLSAQPATRQALEKSIQAGCDDALVLYLEARCVEMSGTNDPAALDQLYLTAMQKMEGSQYPPVRKCFTYLRYSSHMISRVPMLATADQPPPQEVGQNISHCLDMAWQIWPEVTRTPDIPPDFLVEIVGSYLDIVSQGVIAAKGSDRKPAFDYFCQQLDQALPNSAPILAFKGKFYCDYAWDARGRGYASTVTPEGWKLMGERLAMAEQVLLKAWELNPNDSAAPTQMLTVELGQGKGREVMETWFKRAMKANPDNREACTAKMYYLEPKWHGSPQDMIAFGHECRDSQNWYGRLPFLLAEGHQTLSGYIKDPDAYFHQPEVWEDLQSVYKPWLEAWPDDAAIRSIYTRYACRCGRWGDARQQFQILGDKAVPEQFGGADKMEVYRKTAMGGGL